MSIRKPAKISTGAHESLRRGGLAVPSAWAAAFAVVLGSILRVWSLTTPNAQIDGDQAITGLMVEKMLHGTDGYVFMAGQAYNGAIEQYVQVAIYWVLPIPHNSFTLRLPEVLWSAVAIWLVYIVGVRLLSRRAAALAAVLFAVGPYWSFWKSIHSDGSYPSIMVIGLIALYCATRMVAEPCQLLRWSAGFGVCAGLIAWNGLTGLELLIPAGLWCARLVLRSWRSMAVMAAGAILGALPLIGWSIHHRFFPLLDLHLNTVDTSARQRIGYLFGPILREFIGVASNAGAPGWPETAQLIATLAVAGAFSVALYRRRYGLIDLLALRNGRRLPVDALLVSIVIVGFTYTSSKYSWDIDNPHYLYAFTPVLVWLIAAMFPSKVTWPRIMPILVVFALFIGTSLTMLANRADKYPGTSDADLKAVSTYLIAHHETHVYADYWTAIPLKYLSQSKVIAVPIGAGQGKFPADNQLVWASNDAVYVDTSRNDSGRIVWTPPPIAANLTAHHVAFRAVRIGLATIYEGLEPATKPWQVGLGPRTVPAKAG